MTSHPKKTPWESCKDVGIPCAGCGKIDTCTVAPDHTAFKCWRNGGRVIQTRPHPLRNRRDAACRVAPKPRASRPSRSYETVEAAIQAVARQVRGTFVQSWVYRNPDGIEYAQVVRYALADGDKAYRPIHRTKTGWRLGDPSGPWPLYRVRELSAAGPVFVTEGEKTVDAAWSIGMPATTSAHGAGASASTDWQPLAGRPVYILPDHDEAGRGYARDVAAHLVQLDPPARVKIVELPGLPDAGDIVEFIAARRDLAPEAIRGEIEALVEAAPWVDRSELVGGPVLISLADVEAEPVEWLWPGRMALGCITLLVGKPGEGKSFLTIDMAARVSTGTPWPDGGDCPSGSVILVCAEDDPARVIRPRLDAQDADPRRIHLLSAVRRIADDGQHRETMFTLADLAALEAALKTHADCKLVVIDPIGSYLGGQVDAYRDNEVRAVLAPVAKLAKERGIAVVVVAHRRKDGSGSADDLALGSRAFTGLARAVWHVCRDQGNPNRRLLLPGKNNLAAEGTGLAFTIGGQPVAQVTWERDPVLMRADDALAAEFEEGSPGKPGPAPSTREAAAEWLTELLANGAMPVGDRDDLKPGTIAYEAQAAGYAWGTVRRAQAQLRIKPYKERFEGGWRWKLPEAVQQQLSDAQASATCASSADPAHLPMREHETGVVGLPDAPYFERTAQLREDPSGDQDLWSSADDDAQDQDRRGCS